MQVLIILFWFFLGILNYKEYKEILKLKQDMSLLVLDLEKRKKSFNILYGVSN